MTIAFGLIDLILLILVEDKHSLLFNLIDHQHCIITRVAHSEKHYGNTGLSASETSLSRGDVMAKCVYLKRWGDGNAVAKWW